MFHFYTPWKHQKTGGFQGVYKWNIGWKWVKLPYFVKFHILNTDGLLSYLPEHFRII